MPGQAYQVRHDGLVSSALKFLISINGGVPAKGASDHLNSTGKKSGFPIL